MAVRRILTVTAPLILMPVRPLSAPSRSRPEISTSVPVPLTVMALPDVAVMLAPTTPSQMIDTDFVIDSAPNVPGSRQLTVPPGAVLDSAPMKVRQGLVAEHGLTSSPAADTQVLCACAKAGTVISENPTSVPSTHSNNAILFIFRPQVIA